MVVGASVLLSILFKEKYGFWAQSQLKKYRDRLRMSTVNLAEVLIHLQDRQPQIFDQLKKKIFKMPIQFIPPTTSQAEMSAWARLKFPALNLGDCFAYALAKEESCPILTLDGDFAKSDAEVLLPSAINE